VCGARTLGECGERGALRKLNKRDEVMRKYLYCVSLAYLYSDESIVVDAESR
jgi:hypothetical protein